jgi:uncharacterized protein YjeT (DUF2065 family)
MNQPLWLTVSIACIAAGGCTLLWPKSVSHFQEDAETSPSQAIREVRIGGGFLLFFGLALLYALLTWDGKPAEFIGV